MGYSPGGCKELDTTNDAKAKTPVLYSKSALLMVPVNLSCLLDRVPRIWLAFGKVPELIYITSDITVYSNEHPP